MNHNKCNCPHCMAKPGHILVQVMIGHPIQPPMPCGTIEIITEPLLVEDWMIAKVAQEASASLGKYIVESNQGKVEH